MQTFFLENKLAKKQWAIRRKEEKAKSPTD